jgi:hypothetical protein
MDTHLEVVVIPVSGVDRAKAFYSMLGWRLDATPGGLLSWGTSTKGQFLTS